MKEDTLSNCLMMKCEGQSIQEFDPQPAINLWFNLKPHRRPGTGGSQQNKAGNNKRNALLIYLFTIFLFVCNSSMLYVCNSVLWCVDVDEANKIAMLEGNEVAEEACQNVDEIASR